MHSKCYLLRIAEELGWDVTAYHLPWTIDQDICLKVKRILWRQSYSGLIDLIVLRREPLAAYSVTTII